MKAGRPLGSAGLAAWVHILFALEELEHDERAPSTSDVMKCALARSQGAGGSLYIHHVSTILSELADRGLVVASDEATGARPYRAWRLTNDGTRHISAVRAALLRIVAQRTSA